MPIVAFLKIALVLSKFDLLASLFTFLFYMLLKHFQSMSLFLLFIISIIIFIFFSLTVKITYPHISIFLITFHFNSEVYCFVF
ncbi:hypothetical protein ACJX0J_033080, partial [Zea mays]